MEDVIENGELVDKKAFKRYIFLWSIIGVMKAIGNIYMKSEIDKSVALPVNTVTHQVIAKLTIDEPIIENNCPDHKKM